MALQPPPPQYQGHHYGWWFQDPQSGQQYFLWWQNDQIYYSDSTTGQGQPLPQQGAPQGGGTRSSGGSSGGGGSGGGGAAGPFLTDVFGNHYSKAQFDAYLAQVKHLGAIYGVPISDSLARTMLKQGVDASEAQQRFTEIQAVESTKANRAILQRILDARGIKEDVTSFQGARKFILGAPEGQAQRVWDEFATSAAAHQAGFSIQGVGNAPNKNQDLRLSRGNIIGLEKTLGAAPGSLDMSQLAPVLQEAAQLALKNLPASRFKRYGVSKQDVLSVAAGRGSIGAQQAVTRIANEETAFEAQRANPRWALLRQQNLTDDQRQVGASAL